MVKALLLWPYNDLNSRFVVLASYLAVKHQISGFGISTGRKTADLWFSLLYWLYNYRFVGLAFPQFVQRLEKQISCFGFFSDRTTT